MVTFEAMFGCHDILLLGKSLIKWRQHPDMTITVDWGVKHQFKQANQSLSYISELHSEKSGPVYTLPVH